MFKEEFLGNFWVNHARFFYEKRNFELTILNSALVGFLDRVRRLVRWLVVATFRLLVFFFFDNDASPYLVNKKKTTDSISDLFVAAISSRSEFSAVALVGLPATNWSIGFCCFFDLG